VGAGPEETGGNAAEDGALRPRAGNDLGPADRALVKRIEVAGWAATPEEVGAHPNQIGCLADAGVAYLRAYGKRAVLAMSGATAGDVRPATARAECQEKGTGERQEQGCPGKEESPEKLAAEILRRLEQRGGALEERTLEVSLRSRAALALLAGRGEIRKIRCRSSGTMLVALADAPRGSVAHELRRVADLRAALEEERRESMKPHVSEVERVGGKPVAEWLVGFRRAVEGRGLKPGQVRELIRRELPFRVGLHDALGEDDEIEEWQRSHARRREENARIIRRDLAAGIVPRACGVSPGLHWTQDPALRRCVEAQPRTGLAARNTARAIYITSLPTLAHKVLHLPRRDGRRPPERFVALARAHDPGSGRPEEFLEEAVRQLGEAGKVRRMRSRKTGRVYLEATKGLDGPSYERDLGRIVRSEEYRILVPWRGRQRITPDKTRSASTAVPGESSA
jgi:hypothetical protein